MGLKKNQTDAPTRTVKTVTIQPFV